MSTSKKTILFLPVLACLLAAVFIYLSLLGENSRIGTVVQDFFAGIRQNEYPQTLQYLSRDFREAVRDKEEAFFEQCFLLELTLLENFDLLDQSDYLIETRKAHLWVPYLCDNSVEVSVALQERKPKNLFSYLRGTDSRNFIGNLFTVVRENGSWKISRINYADSAVGEIFAALKRDVKLDEYLHQTPNGFRVSSFAVKTEGMSPLENRRISFIIHKVLRYLREDDTGSDEAGGLPIY